MTDAIEDLAVLRERSDVLLEQVSGAQARVEPAQAADGTGQVTVRLDADGSLRQVQVGFTWDQQLTASELPGAVLEAVTQARVRQVEQDGEAIRAIEDEPEPRARPARTDAPMLDAFRERVEERGGGTDAARDLAEEILLDARAGLDEADRLLDEHAGRCFSARSTSGHVTASALGNGDLTSLDLDASWVARAQPVNLGREITEAMLAAAHGAPRGARRRPPGDPSRRRRPTGRRRRATRRPRLRWIELGGPVAARASEADRSQPGPARRTGRRAPSTASGRAGRRTATPCPSGRRARPSRRCRASSPR